MSQEKPPMHLEQAALAFAKECLVWEDAYLSHLGDVGDIVKQNRKLLCDFLIPDDLNAVIDAVRRWGDKHHLWIHLGNTQYPVPGTWWVEIGRLGVRGLMSNAYLPDLPNALLSACVEAARKLRAGEAPRVVE